MRTRRASGLQGRDGRLDEVLAQAVPRHQERAGARPDEPAQRAGRAAARRRASAGVLSTATVSGSIRLSMMRPLADDGGDRAIRARQKSEAQDARQIARESARADGATGASQDQGERPTRRSLARSAVVERQPFRLGLDPALPRADGFQEIERAPVGREQHMGAVVMGEAVGGREGAAAPARLRRGLVERRPRRLRAVTASAALRPAMPAPTIWVRRAIMRASWPG